MRSLTNFAKLQYFLTNFINSTFILFSRDLASLEAICYFLLAFIFLCKSLRLLFSFRKYENKEERKDGNLFQEAPPSAILISKFLHFFIPPSSLPPSPILYIHKGKQYYIPYNYTHSSLLFFFYSSHNSFRLIE